jgi:hypothetical protein
MFCGIEAVFTTLHFLQNVRMVPTSQYLSEEATGNDNTVAD